MDRRKAFRALGIGPALDLPAGDGAFRRVYPFRRAWIPILFIAAFDVAFLFPAVTVFISAAQSWSQVDDLGGLTGALFQTAWLLGWSLAPLGLTTVLCVMLLGRESIRLEPRVGGRGSLRLFIGLPGVGFAGGFDPRHARNLRLVTPAAKGGKSWRGRHLAFDYGERQVDFGSNLDETDLETLRQAFRTVLGSEPREGDALPEDIEALTAAATALAPESSSPVANRAPDDLEAAPLRLTSPSSLALIAANLLPLLGSVFWGWRLSDVMVLYWAESAVVGFWNLCRMGVIGRWFALPAGLFFLGHYGAFMAVHFLFLYSLFVEGPGSDVSGDLREVAALFLGLWPALVALFLSHGVSFFTNFLGREEYRGRSLGDQMSEPYRRIIFMHLVLIFGGGLTLVLGEATPVLLLVIAAKIAVDLHAHVKQHGARRQSRS